MASSAKKTFSVKLPMDEYNRFAELAEELQYSEIGFGEILLCYAIPRWEVAVDQHVEKVKQSKDARSK